jgi:hypothetical protein
MGLDLWFRQDVARILAAAWETMQATAEGIRGGTVATSKDEVARAYERGFEDALRAVAVAFGLAGGARRDGTASGTADHRQQAEYRTRISGHQDGSW